MKTPFDSMFREYDVRGRVSEDELNGASVYRIAAAYARYLKDRKINSAVVGYDNRTCSPGFAEAATKALRAMGIDVVSIGLCTTPAAYYAQYHYKCEGVVMITASHNPNGWSGFKLGKGYSSTLEPEDIKALYAYAAEEPPAYTGAEGKLRAVDIWPDYVNAVVSRIKMGPHKPRLVLDAGNGGAGLFAYEIFQRLGCTAFQLNCDPDMEYPHYFPNPSDVAARERLKEMVTHPYVKADIGLSFDGDGDRLGVVDGHGGDIWSDTILAVLAQQLLQTKPQSKVVFDVKCSQTLQDVIEHNNGVPVMCKTGHSYIKAKLREVDAELAGERSGHIFVGGDAYYGYDDAIFVAAKLVEYMSHTPKSISGIISEFPRYVTSPEIKAHCADTEKYRVIDAVTEEFERRYPGNVVTINGARVSFDHGWGLIRASSNLPEAVLIFEADTLEHMLEIRSVFREVTSKYPEISAEWENDV